VTQTELDQLIKKAEKGDTEAMFALAQCYRDGEGVAQDFGQFLDWLMLIRIRFGFDAKIKSLLSFEGRPENALTNFVAWLQDSAAAGQARHMNFLANLYREGEGVEKDLEQWIEWLHKAIAAGDAWSMKNLAWAYHEGEGVEKDLKQWIEWLHKAIAAGDAGAMKNLAWAYHEGEGVEKDLKQYVEWLRKAIAAGDAWAMNNLAWAYHEGEGVEKDLKQYIEWLHKAIAAGDEWSMKNLALDYRYGIGVTVDLQQSMHWFFRAAEGRDEFALDEIRRMYQSREFETANLDASITWLTQAAVIEDANLFVELAMKHKARNQTGDDEQFHYWLRKAEDLGNIHAFILRSLHRIQLSETIDDSLINQLTDALFELSRGIDAIKLEHLIRDGDENIAQVAHFTTLEALHSMLPVSRGKGAEEENYTEKNRLLRLYNIAYMNDPQEGRRLLDIEHENSELLGDFFAMTQQGNNHNFLWENQEFSVYCGSFTLRVDRLDLWRAYGRDGSGYCLVIPSRIFQQEPKSNPSHFVHDALRRGDENRPATRASQSKLPALYQIRYRQDEAEKALQTLRPILKVLKEIKEKEKNPKITELIDSLVRIVISDILYLYKNEEYASEEEARMIVAHNIADKVLKLDDNQPPRIYVETDAFLFRDEGTRIIIGPKVGDKVAAELNLKYRLARHGLLKTTSVEWSEVKYR